MKTSKVFLLAIILLSTGMFAQDSWNIELIEHHPPGEYHNLHGYGEYTFTTYYSWLKIFDTSDPSEIELVSYLNTGYRIRDIAFKDSCMYLFGGSNVMLIYNISDPESPLLIDSLIMDSNTRNAKVYKNYLFVNSDSITIYDISDPFTPSEIVVFGDSAAIYNFDFIGDYFVCTEWENGLNVFDFSVISAPVHVFHHDSVATNVLIDNGFAYVQAYWDGTNIFDMSDPSTPVLISSIMSAWDGSLLKYGNYLYIVGSEFAIIDVSDPYAPIETYTSEEINNICVNENLIITTEDVLFLCSYDLEDSLLTTPLDQFYSYSIHDNITCIGNNILYSDEYLNFVTVDSFPTTPHRLFFDIYNCEIEFMDDFCYVLDRRGAFHVFDISDPDDFREINVTSVSRFFNRMALYEDFLILGCDSAVDIYDISNPAFPELAAYHEYLTRVRDMACLDNILYIAAPSSAYDTYVLKLYDLTDPTSLELILETSYSADNMTIIDNYLYVNVYPDGFGIYDLSTPTSPSFITWLPGINAYYSIKDNFLFATDSIRLRVFDIEDPTDIIEYGYFELPSTAMSLDISDSNIIYLSTRDDGLYKLDASAIFEEPSLGISTGWNLVSFPFEAIDTAEVTSMTGIEAIYSYNTPETAYFIPSSFSPGIGYWTLSSDSLNIPFVDFTSVDTVSVQLYPGWNLIGIPDFPVSTDILLAYPEIISAPYTYNVTSRTYEETDMLFPMNGYWIFSTDSLEISLP